jgi:feruloyl esterase
MRISGAVCVVVGMVGWCGTAFAADCASLKGLKLEHVKVTTAEVVSGGTLTLEGQKPMTGLPEFCRVAATIDPAGESDIKVEVWMPVAGWNGKIEGTGHGGLAGHISYGALGGGVKAGYAVANTDMGTSVPAGMDGGVYLDKPDRWKDWGYRSTHEMTVLSKELVKAFYGTDAKKSYFVGCSTGGEQALMEAQRYPEDYDGIVGGAPAHDRTPLHVSILWGFVVDEKTPGAYLPPAKVSLLSAAAVQACDVLDGVKDGMIADPRVCHFDPGVLACKAGEGADCLTAAQVETARKVYAGPKDPRTGRSIYPGLERGSEFGWNGLGPAPSEHMTAPFAPMFEWVFGPKWDWRTFDFGADVDAFNGKLGAVLNANDPDLDRFRADGHKMVIYHGWGDPLVPPAETTMYYDAVLARDRARHAATPLDSSVRLFMVPGMAHCGGGPGLGPGDEFGALVKWVEDGVAPATIASGKTVTAQDGMKTVIHRPLCPYPKEAVYDGKGDSNDAASFACRVPEGSGAR